MSEKSKDDHGSGLRDLQRYGNVGIDFAVTVLAGFGIGYFLDRWLGTTPWFMIAGVLWGTISAFLSLYHKTLFKDEKKDNGERND